MDKQQITKKVHNIVASLVMAEAERTLRDELRYLGAKTRPVLDVFHGGRKAMEALLLSDAIRSEHPIVEYMRSLIIEYIDDALRRTGSDDVALDRVTVTDGCTTVTSCTHECHTDDGTYIETFRRIYRDDTGIAVEYSDHVPADTTPDTFYGDYLDAFSLDELVEIARALTNLDTTKKP
jgi:predicted SnoaL-like aldol condensation-catalyzing enzyme